LARTVNVERLNNIPSTMKHTLLLVLTCALMLGCSRRDSKTAGSPDDGGAPPPPAEPVYEGRNLSEWFADLNAHLQVEEDRPATGERQDPGTNSSLRIPRLTPGEKAAQEAIRSLGTNSLPFLVHHVASQSITPVANDPVRLQLVFRLLGTNAVPAIPALLAAMKTSQLSENVPRYLAQIGPPAVPAIIRTLGSANPGVRYSAAYAIAQVQSNVELAFWQKPMEQAKREGKDRYRVETWDSIQIAWRPTNAIPELRRMLEDKSKYMNYADADPVCFAAATALQRLGEPPEVWVPTLLRQRNDVAGAVAVYVGSGKTEEIMARMRRDLTNVHPDVRYAAAHGLWSTLGWNFKESERDAAAKALLEEFAGGTDPLLAPAARNALENAPRSPDDRPAKQQP
jgi:hypothetical protein